MEIDDALNMCAIIMDFRTHNKNIFLTSDFFLQIETACKLSHVTALFPQKSLRKYNITIG